MMGRIPEASPRPKARLAGLIYLLNFLTGVVAVPGFRLIVSGDAAATATNILAHETLFRLSFAALLLNVAAYIAVTALFYDLFKPVNRLPFLSPPLANYLSPYDTASGILGEASVFLWLLVMGVNVQRWKEQARAAE
jgi:Domain of unknown function (DUF4386)